MYRNSRGYWLRSHRAGTGATSRVVSEYLGGGEHWAALATLEDLEAHRVEDERRRVAAQVEATQAQVLALEEPAAQAWRLVEGVLRGALEGAGYRQHKRGEWRKPRQSTMAKSKTEPSSNAQNNADLATLSTNQLILAGNKPGGEAAVAEAFKRIQGTPEEAKLLNVVTDLARKARESIVGDPAKNPLLVECFARQFGAMQAELGGPNPSPLERLLVERIVNSWLLVHQIERLLLAQEMNHRSVCEYLDRRLDRAHGRYLAAIRSLAQVRKLALPAPAAHVQINVASNVAQQQLVTGADAQGLVSPAGRVFEPLGIEGKDS